MAGRASLRRILGIVLVPLVLAAMLFLLVTDSAPLVPPQREATAEQVDLGRDAYRTLRASRETGKPSLLVLDQPALDAIGAMLTQGFPPARIAARIEGERLVLTASRPVLFRWVNVRTTLTGAHKGFPPLATEIGGITVPQSLVRQSLGLARRILNRRGAGIPPLEHLVAATAVGDGRVTASVILPRTGPIRAALGVRKTLDGATVAGIYCTLVREQFRAPDPLFAHQLTRALSASAPTREGHGAALVALAMLMVSPDIAEPVEGAVQKSAKCLAPPMVYTLHGRPDSPKHWALSAALSVMAGQSISEAMGEWKELSDSLAASRFLARNDTSGFSFVDLATDRAGFLTARALLDPERLADRRAALLAASDATLLPPSALRLGDGMPSAQFVARYGATDDPRFAAAVRDIDAMLKAGGID